MNDIRKFPDTAEEPTWMTVLSLLESTNAYDEQKFIAIWKDLSMEAQLSVLSYKWGRPNLLINASEELCMALLNSKYTYVRYKSAGELQFKSGVYPSIRKIIESDPDPLVRNAIYEFGYKKPFLNDGDKPHSYDRYSSPEFVSRLLDSDSDMRRAILADYDLPLISKTAQVAIELIHEKNDSKKSVSSLMSFFKDFTWNPRGDYYRGSSNYERRNKCASACNELWISASNLGKNKLYKEIATYIASNLPWPPDRNIWDDLCEPVLILALERNDLFSPGAACQDTVLLEDYIVNSIVSSPESNRNIIQKLRRNRSISVPYWVALNEAANDAPNKFDIVEFIEMQYLDEEHIHYLGGYYREAALILFAHSLINKSANEEYHFLGFREGIPIPLSFIDIIMLRWSKSSSYDHQLYVANRVVENCSIYVDVGSVWKTYLNIKSAKYPIRSFWLLVPDLFFLGLAAAKNNNRQGGDSEAIPDLALEKRLDRLQTTVNWLTVAMAFLGFMTLGRMLFG